MLDGLRKAVEVNGAEAVLRHLLSATDWSDPGAVAYADQVRAAADEAETTLLHKLGPALGLENHVQIPVETALPLVLGGVLRCMAHSHCQHARTGTVPLYAFLAARVIACKRCLGRYTGALVAAEQRNRHGDRRCDFCLDWSEDGSFTLSGTHFGPVQIFGDACDTCHAGLRTEAVAA